MNNTISVMPPEIKEKMLPFMVVKLLSGAEVSHPYAGDKFAVNIRYEKEDNTLNLKDFLLVKNIADELQKEVVLADSIQNSVTTQINTMRLLYQAGEKIRIYNNELYKDKKRILWVKADDSGCGFWRMEMPSGYMNKEKWVSECQIAETYYEYLIHYDVIVVQRICNWSQFYIIDRLKRFADKTVIYDLDDDIFHIPPNNRAAEVYTKSAQICARHIMQLADGIITTNDRLSGEIGHPEKTFIFPNSINIEDWRSEFKVSPDDIVRIFWAGSATHEEDFKLCVDAIFNVLKKYENTRLTIVGYLPECLQDKIPNNKWLENRIEYQGFLEVESYMSLLHRLKMDIGICPLENNIFNLKKSNVKWVEMTSAGVPVVMSDNPVYTDYIEHGKDALIARNSKEWEKHLSSLVEDVELRKKIYTSARENVCDNFNIVDNSANLSDWIEGLMVKK